MNFSIGIDIGGTNTEIGIFDKNGNLFGQDKFSTQRFECIDLYISYISSTIHQLLEQNNINLTQIKGIGVGAPNGNYKTGKIDSPPNLKLGSQIFFVDNLKKYFQLPIILTNDAKAAAIGEKVYGGAKSMNDYIMITLGTGLGCGIVSNGRLVYGKCGMAGEFGHCMFEYKGRKCTCGKSGCLESYVSIRGIKQTYYDICKQYKIKIDNFEKLTIKDISTKAKENELVARETFQHTAEILGRKMADLGELFSPECIFLAGGISKAGNFFLDNIRKNFEENLLSIYKGSIKVELSHIDKNVGIMGASSLVW